LRGKEKIVVSEMTFTGEPTGPVEVELLCPGHSVQVWPTPAGTFEVSLALPEECPTLLVEETAVVLDGDKLSVYVPKFPGTPEIHQGQAEYLEGSPTQARVRVEVPRGSTVKGSGFEARVLIDGTL
jgi:hypothetical protein